MPEPRRINENELSDEQRDAERALRQLVPKRALIDPSQIWAAAMHRRDASRVWFWRCVSGGLAAALAMALWPRQQVPPRYSPPSTGVEFSSQAHRSGDTSLVGGTQGPVPPMFLAGTDDNYLQLRQRVLRSGINGLAEPKLVERSSGATAPAVDSGPAIERALPPATGSGPVMQFLKAFSKGSEI